MRHRTMPRSTAWSMKLHAARSAPGRACSVRDAMTSPSARLWSPSYAINTVPFQRNEPNNREIDARRWAARHKGDGGARRRNARPSMLNSIIGRTVDFCTRNARLIIALGVIFAAACGLYTVRHFAVNTDLANLISSNLPWRQRELAYERRSRKASNRPLR